MKYVKTFESFNNINETRVATKKNEIKWEKTPYGIEISKYKNGIIMKMEYENGNIQFSVEIDNGDKTAIVQNAKNLDDAIKRIDNKGYVPITD